VTTATVGRDP